jgi:hypothetical protein
LQYVVALGVADEQLDDSGAARFGEAGRSAGGRPEGPLPVH